MRFMVEEGSNNFFRHTVKSRPLKGSMETRTDTDSRWRNALHFLKLFEKATCEPASFDSR
jgi:hypothetical protein